MSHPDITVVICTYNRAEMLRGALNSLMRQDTGGQFSYEIVVVDDASTDATPTAIMEATLRSPILIRHVRGPGRGIGCARNAGIAEASGDWIAFLDDDMVAETGWLKELFACAAQTGAQVIGGSNRLLMSDEELSKVSPFCRELLGETDVKRLFGKYPVRATPGCGNMLVKTTLFEAVGRFDESCIRGGEDTQFGVRVRRAGLEAWFTPKAIAHHLVPAYRLEAAYLTWCAMRVGDNIAYRDFVEWGLVKTAVVCIVRIGRAFLIKLPFTLWAYLGKNRAEALGCKCLVLREWAYLRESLYLVSPRLFSQNPYFSRLNFRGERVAFAGDAKVTD